MIFIGLLLILGNRYNGEMETILSFIGFMMMVVGIIALAKDKS